MFMFSAILYVVAVQLSLVATQTNVHCPVRFYGNRCEFLGRVLDHGQSMNSIDPCSRITCNARGRTVSISGCPPPSGDPTHPGAAGPTPTTSWPSCCTNACPNLVGGGNGQRQHQPLRRS
uniref:Putative 8.9 kDa family member n=1 Tax=Rhipicephalus pulchellus TaxID=72859 RepID=L7LQ25_RHIPC